MEKAHFLPREFPESILEDRYHIRCLFHTTRANLFLPVSRGVSIVVVRRYHTRA